MIFDLIIRNGLYFDGSKQPAVIADIAISEGKIAEISPNLSASAKQEIDATGKWVCPGFIEPHSHYDAEIIAAPELAESVRHGVTTVITGLCSISAIYAAAEDCSDLFTRVEAVPRSEVLPLLQTKKTWANAKQFKHFFQQHPLGPNLAAFIGHSDIRAATMGLVRSASNATPTPAEYKEMAQYLHEALDAGLLGLSTMTTKLDRLDGDRAWAKSLPSTYATWKEYRLLNRILRQRKAILQSAPDAVGKINIFAFFWEACGLFRQQLKTTLLTVLDLKAQPYLHKLGPFAGFLAKYLLRANFRWQFMPSPMVVYSYGLDFNAFGELADAQILREFRDPADGYKEIQKPEFRATLRKDMQAVLTAGLWHRDFSDGWVVKCPDASMVGKNFAEIGQAAGQDPIDAFLDLVLRYKDDLRWAIQFGNHRPHIMRKLIASPYVHIGFADSGAHLENLASYNFPICLLKYVVDGDQLGEKSLSIEHAIHRLTGELADWYGLDAGYIRKGDRADIAIVDPAGLTDDVWDIVDAPFPAFNITRLVNRNDQAVTTTIINGKVAYTEQTGYAEGLGKELGYGQFLAAQHTV